ncbi:MAG: hypothetical protein JWM90_558 [Thermoleophilia bacterium]|nr:hypothetical protein [Thermoleophilia bacterium]
MSITPVMNVIADLGAAGAASSAIGTTRGVLDTPAGGMLLDVLKLRGNAALKGVDELGLLADPRSRTEATDIARNLGFIEAGTFSQHEGRAVASGVEYLFQQVIKNLNVGA